MAKEVITIIGSTGTIGTELVRLLSSSNTAIRAVLRHFARAQSLPGVSWIKADLSDERLLDSALAGTDRLFLLTGNDFGFSETQIKVIKAAERLGVKYVVKVSALGASPRTKSPLAYEHWQVEKALETSAIQWTTLRPHSFMQNWLTDVAETVRNEGIIYGAIGEGKVPFIDARDIAAVAAEILLNPNGHTGKYYVLTGDEAFGYQRLADALTRATARPVAYKSLSMDEMRGRMEKQGIKTKMIESLLALAAYQKAGGPTERVSADVSTILQRPARSVEDFANDYKTYFMREK